MRIETEKGDGQQHLLLQGGWVSDQVTSRVRKTLTLNIWNCSYTGGLVGRAKVLDNRIDVTFTGRDGDIAEVIDYINVVCRDVIPTAFTSIGVSPYDLPDYNNEGGLTILREIQKETGCAADWGAWLEPVKFYPETNVQYNAVIDLLQTFKLKYHAFESKE